MVQNTSDIIYSVNKYFQVEIFKPGACWLQAGIRLVSRNHFCAVKVCVCVYVCMSTPKAINN